MSRIGSATQTKRPADLPEAVAPSKRVRRVNTQPQSPLFRLPREIRNNIYLFALAKDHPVALLDTSHDDSSDSEPTLLYTCCRARDEALPLFYSSNDWIVKTRRVGGDSGRLDPVSKRCIMYQSVPRWLERLPDERVALIRNIVLVGSRGSYVDIGGKWREGGRVAFRLKRLNGKLAYRVEEVHDEDGICNPEDQPKDAFCSVQLVDLLRARMRINLRDCRGNWIWTKDRIHDLAVLL